MKKSQQLYALIHSMSKSERRYLKLNNSKENSIYMQIFDAIVEQSVYDATALKKILFSAGINSSISRIQHHLYQLILKSLAAYQDAKTTRYKVLNAIKYYLILRDRGLHSQGRKLLQKALQLALRHNYYGLALEIYDLMEDWITEEASYATALSHYHELKEASQVHLLYSRSVVDLKKEIYELRLFFLKQKFARTKAQKNFLLTFVELYEPQLKIEKNLLKRRLLLTILIYTYYGLQEYAKLIVTEKKRLALLDEDAISAHISPFLVYAYHRNLLWILLSNKNYKEHQYLVKHLSEPSSIKGLANSKFYTIKLTIAKSVTQLYAKVAQQHYHQAYHQIEQLWQLQKDYQKYWDTSLLVHSLILFINTTFCLGKYNETISWLRLLEQDIPQTYLLPYQNMGKIAHLLIHDGLEDYQYVQNVLESTRIRLYRKHDFFEVATVFLKYFKQQVNLTNTLEQQKLLLKYKAAMEKVAKQEGQKGFFILFNFVDWFDSKLKKCAIANLSQNF
ncbi:hypothetical protein [Aureispira anguillae]|uniref:Uncharacterized protein n=1 Tax=Aureispira anguillae TaxID=2864201 RepID=A0A915YKK0_9BACT|nr:hypothetical protein [Aureispira anguillae]BDS14927.1 hypothetical protein AsAng_0057090 [Aureispira anguillae]